jgi:hypothetical protein
MLLLAMAVAVPIFSASAVSPVRLENGIYEPIEGNNPSICPQKVQAVLRDGLVRELRVAYVGDCFYEGPYTYECDEGGVCASDTVRFEIIDTTSYRWTSLEQNIRAKFKWKGLENSHR